MLQKKLLNIKKLWKLRSKKSCTEYADRFNIKNPRRCSSSSHPRQANLKDPTAWPRCLISKALDRYTSWQPTSCCSWPPPWHWQQPSSYRLRIEFLMKTNFFPNSVLSTPTTYSCQPFFWPSRLAYTTYTILEPCTWSTMLAFKLVPTLEESQRPPCSNINASHHSLPIVLLTS